MKVGLVKADIGRLPQITSVSTLCPRAAQIALVDRDSIIARVDVEEQVKRLFGQTSESQQSD